jgi:hypothetical protein
MKGTVMEDKKIGFEVDIIMQIEELEAKKAPSVTLRPNTIVWDNL